MTDILDIAEIIVYSYSLDPHSLPLSNACYTADNLVFTTTL